MTMSLDQIIRRSLARFVQDIDADRWTGRREREAISLYVLGYLQREVGPRGPLRDVTQIAIEVPVRQIDERIMVSLSGRTGAKRDVAKDLVIWGRPRQTCWDASGRSGSVPLAIMEWKFGRREASEYDIRWLEEYSRRRPAFTGYAVALQRVDGRFRLSGVRVRLGRREADWIRIGVEQTVSAGV
jgi:hypothetical protein